MNITIKYKYNGIIYNSFYELKLAVPFISFPSAATKEVLKSLGIEVIEEEETLELLKLMKLRELKKQRDTKEIAPIEYSGNTYDFDSKSRDRLDIALKALTVQGVEATIEWTMADNSRAAITGKDILNVFVASAERSNVLHNKYRNAKEKIMAAQTKEELDGIKLE